MLVLSPDDSVPFGEQACIFGNPGGKKGRGEGETSKGKEELDEDLAKGSELKECYFATK